MRLTREEAIALASTEGTALNNLCSHAAAVRDRHWGRQVSYSRKVFIPLTNLCRNRCGYCTFVKQPGQPGAGYLSPQALIDIARLAEQAGCKEALFSLGERPEDIYPQARETLAWLGYTSTISYLHDMCQRIINETGIIPHINAGALSGAEMTRLRPVCASMGMMLETSSRRLMQRGQAHHGCPDKLPVKRLHTLHEAGRLNIPFTTGILIGIGETWAERIDSLLAIADIHQQYGHIQEVIVQNFRTKPNIAMAHHPEPTHDDMRRTLTIARLLLPPQISLQAPPNLATHYEDYLAAGINDWGGISPVSIDHINPERAWPAIDTLAQTCAMHGFHLVERLTVYPRFTHEREAGRYLDPAIAMPVARLSGEDGLAKRAA